MAQPWGLIIILLMRKCQRPDYEVTVEFDGAGTRKMFAMFAKLAKI